MNELHQLTEDKRKLVHIQNKITYYQSQIHDINKALNQMARINKDELEKDALENFEQINLLRAPCTYPRSKTTGYYGAENQKRRATLTSKTKTIMLPVARPRGIASSTTVFHEWYGMLIG